MFVQKIQPDGVAKPAAPYSSVIKVQAPGSLVFVAGVLATDVDGNVMHEGDILAQTRLTVRNLVATLAAAGAAPEDVVKTTTYVVSDAMKAFFETEAFLECLTVLGNPADTLIGVASLAGSDRGQLIEIDAIAATD